MFKSRKNEAKLFIIEEQSLFENYFTRYNIMVIHLIQKYHVSS
jgi:hypothetical protein